jgi:hypothetical protein
MNIYKQAGTPDSVKRGETARTLESIPPVLKTLPPTRGQRSSQNTEGGIVNEVFAYDQRDNVNGNQLLKHEAQNNDRHATKRLEDDTIQRVHSGATQRSGTDRKSSDYLLPVDLRDGYQSPGSDPPEDTDDYINIDLTEEHPDYVNVAQNRVSYLHAVKLDAAKKINQFKNWSSSLAKINSRSDQYLDKPNPVIKVSALSGDELRTTVPPIGDFPQTKSNQPGRKSSLTNPDQTTKSGYENQSVIQEIHDQHQQRIQGSGHNTDLDRKQDQSSAIMEGNEGAEESPQADYINVDVLHQRGSDGGLLVQ